MNVNGNNISFAVSWEVSVFPEKWGVPVLPVKS